MPMKGVNNKEDGRNRRALQGNLLNPHDTVTWWAENCRQVLLVKQLGIESLYVQQSKH